MPLDNTFLSQVANRIATPHYAPSGFEGSILTVAAGSFGFRSTSFEQELTMPTGFDPTVAALFECIVESAYLVATADGVFDDAERDAFHHVVLEACRGAVTAEQLQALLCDLSDQFNEDGLDKRIEMIARTVRRAEHRREVIRIAALLAHVSGGVCDAERQVVTKLASAFELGASEVDAVLQEAHDTLLQANAQRA
jgi:tellurite resistance protein